MIEKVRRSQLRDFTNWIVFSTYLDLIKIYNDENNLEKILKLSNLKELTELDKQYIDELLEKDFKKKNRKYDLANNKIKELKGLKSINQLENDLNIKQLNKISLRLETLNIK